MASPFSSAAVGRRAWIRTLVGAVTAVVAAPPQAVGRAQSSAALDHTAWVRTVLTRMLTVRPGMTRADLLRVFAVEGGISTNHDRVYVSRDCPYFKVRFVFTPIHVNGPEDPHDVIATASTPFLQFTVAEAPVRPRA